MSNDQELRQQWREGMVIDGAMGEAFYAAVRRHRAGNVPMAIWENGQVREVSPFDIPLPDDPAEPPRRRATG